jgi:hypothetical protein
MFVVYVLSLSSRRSMRGLTWVGGRSGQARDADGWTCSHIAAAGGYLAVVGYVINQENELLDAPDDEGDTPLHLGESTGWYFGKV